MTTPPDPNDPAYPGPDPNARYQPPTEPGGAYPPPPAGAYPPAPGYGYGAPPQPEFSVGTALSYGWNRFKENALAWILILLTGFVVTGIINGIGQTMTTNDAWLFGSIVSIIGTIVGWIFQAVYIRGALDEVAGTKPEYGSFFRITNFGPIILTAFLVAIGTVLGLILLIVGAIVFAFFAWFSMTFVLDRNLEPIEAIKASFSLVSKNAGPLFLLALANVGLLIVGALLCGVGLLVAMPVTIMSSTYAYRYFTGGPIAPIPTH